MLNTFRTNVCRSGKGVAARVMRPSVALLFAVAGFIPVHALKADSLVKVTSQSAQAGNDSLQWSQVGHDGTVVGASVNAKSASGLPITVTLAGPNSVISVVCSTSSSTCSWTGSNATSGDTLLWTSDAANGGNGPVTVTFPHGMSGAGATIQADAPGQFVAQIQAFNGSTSLGSFTTTSDTNGDPVYIGVSDQTAPNITSVVFNLTTCADPGGDCVDFGIDTVSLNSTFAAVTLSTKSLTFSSQLVGTTSAAQTVTVTNSGNAPLTVSGISATGDFSQTNTCGSSVAAAGKCSISVTFKPTTTGTRTGSVSISDSASGSPQSVSLTGTGVAPAVSLSSTALTFARQVLATTSAAQVVTLKNTGTSTLGVTSVAVTGDFAQTNTCGSSVTAGGSCTITVTFKPTAIGTRTGKVTITDSAGTSPQAVTLTGTGSEVSLSASSVTFPTTAVGSTSASQIVTLKNVGSTALGITSLSLGGTDPADFGETNTCGTSVAASGSCTLTLTFHPKAINSRLATISIADNGGGSPQTIALSGLGTYAKLSASSIFFPTTVLGSTSAAVTVTLTNVNTAALSITSVTLGGTDSADFTETNTCGTSVAASKSCSFTLTFHPKAIGTRTATVSIVDNGGGSPQVITLSGPGTQVKLSSSTISFPTTKVGSTSASQAVTLTNVGTTALSVTSIALAGTDPGDFTETNTCGTSVAASKTCTLTLTFHPKATGTRTATVSVNDNGGASPQVVSLTGAGD